MRPVTRVLLSAFALAVTLPMAAQAQSYSNDDDVLQGTPPPGYGQQAGPPLYGAPPGYVPQPGYAAPGYAQPGYAPPGYAQPGYPPPLPPGYRNGGYPGYGGPPPGYDPRYGGQRRPDNDSRSVALLQEQRNRTVIALQQQFNQGRISRQQMDYAIAEADRQMNDQIVQQRR